MNKSVYGNSETLEAAAITNTFLTVIEQCQVTNPSPFTAELLLDYMNRTTSILLALLQTNDKEFALRRLNVVRQEIAYLTGTPYVPLTSTNTLTSIMTNKP